MDAATCDGKLLASPGLLCGLALEGLHNHPDGFIAIVVEERDGHIARTLFKSKVEAEGAVQLAGGDSVTESPLELLQIGAGRDLFEKILSDNVLLFQT